MTNIDKGNQVPCKEICDTFLCVDGSSSYSNKVILNISCIMYAQLQCSRLHIQS